MSEKILEKMSDEALNEVAGGVSRDLAAAYDVINGKYGNGAEREAKLKAAGFDYWTVQRLVNGLMKGYDKVARDVINGKYGNGAARPGGKEILLGEGHPIQHSFLGHPYSWTAFISL